MKNLSLRLTVLALSVLCLMSTKKTSAQLSRFDSNKFINEKGDTLNYRLLAPDYNTMRKFPLVIFLHGSGERGNDNESQLKWGVGNFATDQMTKMYPTYVVAPQCPKNLSWANIKEKEKRNEIELLPNPSKPMELLIQLIHQLSKQLPIDTNRIYITGLSMGGLGTFDAIERYPSLFAAAVPICGGGDISKAESIKHIPIWIFHGAEDEAVSYKLSVKMVDALTKVGAHPGFTLYPEVGHFSWFAAYTEPLMYEWLFRQHK